jgi:polyisoprenoid-binding protein YceI
MDFSRLVPSRILSLLLAGIVLAGWAGGAAVQAQPVHAVVDSSDSRIDYTGSAVLHDWTGTSRDVSGSIAVTPTAPAGSSVEIRAPVASFDSGNDRRDGNMREVTEVESYPTVRFRSTDVRPKQWGRAGSGYAGTWEVAGELTFHGETHELTTDVTVRVEEGGRVRAETEFPVSLTKYGIDRPALAWVAPINDVIRVDVQIAAPASGALASGVEVVASDSGRTIRSESVRPVVQSTYPGTRPGVAAAYAEDAGGGATWSLSVHGVTDTATDLTATEQVRLRVDGEFLQPLRVEVRREVQDDGNVEEVKTAFFTRSIFEQIATADRVEVLSGDTRFLIAHPTRHDLRLILDRAPGVSAGGESQP